MNDLVCLCGELIFKSYGDTGKTKVRSAVLVIEENGIAKAICRRCKLEHEVPLVLDEVLAKSLQSKVPERRLVLRKSTLPEVVVRKKS